MSWKSGGISGIRLLESPVFRPAGYPAKSVSGESLISMSFVYPATDAEQENEDANNEDKSSLYF
jgi:hypothetical protein